MVKFYMLVLWLMYNNTPIQIKNKTTVTRVRAWHEGRCGQGIPKHIGQLCIYQVLIRRYQEGERGYKAELRPPQADELCKGQHAVVHTDGHCKERPLVPTGEGDDLVSVNVDATVALVKAAVSQQWLRSLPCPRLGSHRPSFEPPVWKE